jgi:hypothetical protein
VVEGVRSRARVKAMLKGMDAMHVLIEPFSPFDVAGEDRAGEAAKARAAQQGGQGPEGAAGAERRRRKGEEAEWESGVADTRGLEGEGGAK